MSLSLIPPTLPSDFCTLSAQEQVNLLIDGTQVTGSVEGGTVFSTTEPSVDDRDKAWGLLNPDGTFTGKIFTYDDGFWGSEHPYPPSSEVRLMWAGDTADLWNFDGGDGVDPAITAPTTFTGAMWEVDTVFAGRSPMGVGAISGSDPAKSIALNEQYGAGSVTLVNNQAVLCKTHEHCMWQDDQLRMTGIVAVRHYSPSLSLMQLHFRDGAIAGCEFSITSALSARLREVSVIE
jgi:hypothetical protein